MDKMKISEKYISELEKKLEETEQRLKDETTARQSMEISLGRALALSQTIIERMPVGVIIVNRNKIIKSVNQTALDMLNAKSSESVIGKSCHLFICPREAGQCPIIDLGEEINQCETNLLLSDGSMRPVLKTVIPLELDKENVLLEVFVDITRRKKQEEELRILSRAIEQSPSSIVITDVLGNIEYVNPAFTKTTGYTFQEALGKNPRILKPKGKKSSEYIELWETLTSKHVWTGEFNNVKKNGEYYWERAAIGPVLNDKNDITHYVAVKEDITEHKKAEDALKNSEMQLREANVTKDKLFSIIAHDLKNAFNVILSGCSLLSRQIENIDKEKIAFIAGALSKSAANANELLQNLLTWSRLQMNMMKAEPKMIQLSEIAAQTIELLANNARQKNITVNHSIPSGVRVYADQVMITTVLRNLFHNALKFTHPGGQINISIAAAGEDDIETSIADSGIGIEEKDLASLFKINSHLKREGTAGESGTGLGLPLCKDFIERNGGRIRVESQTGKGTTFAFTLPKSKPL